MRNIVKLVIVWGVLLCIGCQAIPANDGTPLTVTSSPAPGTPPQGEANMPPSLPTPADPILQSLLQRIAEDLASRLAIPADEIALVETTEVEWSDSSLDCPQPGVSYLQVITPGYRIILQANDTQYEYHSNRDSYFVYCEDRVPPIIPQP